VRKEFDRRIIAEEALAFVRECQHRAPCHLGGGVALAGAYLGHRVTGDVDIFVHDPAEMRDLGLASLLCCAQHNSDYVKRRVMWSDRLDCLSSQRRCG
jgi:hypothetical protein